MSEQFADVGRGITLCYEQYGSPGDPTVLLIMGLGTQMIAWHEDFCTGLAHRGFHVVRFDNRDVGRSTTVDHPAPKPIEIARRRIRDPAYTLEDMADDAAGLLDVLGVRAAHLVGASMGGMIAQTLAIRHPERVLSLVSIMSTTGNRWVGQPGVALMPTLLRPAPRDPEAFAAHAERLFARIGSRGELAGTSDVATLAVRSMERGMSRRGYIRQLGAIIASGDRTERLRGISVPTVVIHGEVDRLVRPSGGRATAKAIPGAELITIPDMGHDLPRPVWDRIFDAVERNAARAADPSDAAAA